VYELTRSEKLASSARYFQIMALMVTVVWGGFGLFATQLDPNTDFGLAGITIAAIVAAAFAIYWTITAAATRESELRMDARLRELEGRLDIAWLFAPRSELRAQLHPLVRLFAVHTRFPLGMAILGIGGALMWVALLIVAWLIHFDLI
jgi:hypothetical protein